MIGRQLAFSEKNRLARAACMFLNYRFYLIILNKIYSQIYCINAHNIIHIQVLNTAFVFVFFHQLRTTMIRRLLLVHLQKKSRLLNETAAVERALITTRAMKCTERSHCPQDQFITLTRNQKAHITYWIPRQGTSKNITRYDKRLLSNETTDKMQLGAETV